MVAPGHGFPRLSRKGQTTSAVATNGKHCNRVLLEVDDLAMRLSVLQMYTELSNEGPPGWA